jgi:hypothetical protein
MTDEQGGAESTVDAVFHLHGDEPFVALLGDRRVMIVPQTGGEAAARGGPQSRAAEDVEPVDPPEPPEYGGDQYIVEPGRIKKMPHIDVEDLLSTAVGPVTVIGDHSVVRVNHVATIVVPPDPTDPMERRPTDRAAGQGGTTVLTPVSGSTTSPVCCAGPRHGGQHGRTHIN